MTGRIDVLTIFPAYLDPLNLSLVGRARRDGLLEIDVHDVRGWTSDRHRTVDDTPFGGGAGMVMRPDVWGLALDEVLARGEQTTRTLIVPSPAGELLRQPLAEELAALVADGGQLVFACGRYEGIDARVAAYYDAREDVSVREVSIGDYVLNGGEVAALVIIEAVARLLPGVIGNPESLVEESHGVAGLLEYPVYTKPPVWRDLDVPPVLRSGDHGRVSDWRRARAVERTARRRPDLLAALGGAKVRPVRPADVHDVADVAARTFPLACPPGMPAADVVAFVTEHLSPTAVRRYLRDRRRVLLLAEVAGAVVGYTMLVQEKPRDADVASVVVARPTAELSKCYVLPEHHGSGVAGELIAASLRAAEARGLVSLWLGVNQHNARAQRFYSRSGFVRVGTRRFRVGDRWEDDYVMEHPLRAIG